jgi:LPXTG-motif cell wall-anchored protein
MRITKKIQAASVIMLAAGGVLLSTSSASAIDPTPTTSVTVISPTATKTGPTFSLPDGETFIPLPTLTGPTFSLPDNEMFTPLPTDTVTTGTVSPTDTATRTHTATATGRFTIPGTITRTIVEGPQNGASVSDTLPRTGVNVLVYLVIAGTLITLGGAVLYAGRRYNREH